MTIPASSYPPRLSTPEKSSIIYKFRHRMRRLSRAEGTMHAENVAQGCEMYSKRLLAFKYPTAQAINRSKSAKTIECFKTVYREHYRVIESRKSKLSM